MSNPLPRDLIETGKRGTRLARAALEGHPIDDPDQPRVPARPEDDRSWDDL